MRVSVALCTFNGQAFLEQQLQSIVSQDQVPSELVICDDASTDQTLPIVQRFAACHGSLDVRLISNPSRLGTTKNFEQAMRLCRGDVIFMCDQDDIWNPGKVRRLVQEIESGADLAFSNAEVVDQDARPLGYRLWDSLWFGPREQAHVRAGEPTAVFLKHVVAAGGTVAFRAAMRDLVLPIPDMPVAHDAWVALLIAAAGRVQIVDEPLIRYRLHDANQVGLRKLNVWQQFQQARKQIDTHAFRYAADLHAAALARLTSELPAGYQPSPRALAGLREKIRHAESRDAIDGSILRRCRTILCELISLRYFRYSYGWKSVAQDIFLR